MGFTDFLSSRVQTGVSNIFGKIGYNAYIHPYLFIAAGLIITVLSSLGLSNLSIESDGVRLWVPYDSEVISNYDQVIDYFGEFETNCLMIVYTKNGDNILTPTYLDALFDLFLHVSQKLYAKESNKEWYYDELCMRDYPSYPICSSNETNIFALYENQRSNWETQSQINTNLESTPGQTLAELLLADTTVNSTTSLITGGSILRIVWTLSSTTNDTTYEANREFMVEFQDFLLDFKKSDVYSGNSDTFDDLKITFLTSRSFDDEVNRLVVADTPIYIATFTVMFIYLALNLGSFSCIGMRCWIAVFTMIIMVFALSSGYGLGCLFGLKLNSVVLLIPYLLIGVGVDDEILIIEAIDRIPIAVLGRGSSNIDKNLGAKRFSNALKHCGVSISLTTFCSVAAFIVGTNVTMPGVSAFCAFAAICFWMNYMLQFLIFLPLFALDEQRKLARRNFCCWCFKHGESDEGTLSVISQNQVQYHKKAASRDDHDLGDGGDRSNNTNNSSTSSNLDSTPVTLTSRITKYLSVLSFIRYIVIPLLSKRLYRVLLILLFVALFAVSIISLQWLNVESDNKRLVPGDSYTIDYLDAQEAAYGESTIDVVELIINNADWSNKDTRNNIHSIITSTENYQDGSDVFSIGDTRQWLSDFELFINDTINGGITIDDLNQTEFYKYLQVFANTTEYIEWANEILYDNNEDPRKIKSTKFYIDFQLPVSLKNQWEVRNDLTDIIKDNIRLNDEDASGYAFRFQWPYAYFEWSIVELTIWNIGSASGGVLLILCIMMDLKMAFFIIIVVIMIDVELFGWMVLFSVSLDSITFLQLVMAVGLTVDYVIHISHALADAHDSDNDHNNDGDIDADEDFNIKIKIGMSEMGVGVVKGAWTTFLGILALSFSSSLAFRGFFTLFAGIICVAVCNGLFFAPSLMAEFKCLYRGRVHKGHGGDSTTSGGKSYSSNDNNNDTDGGKYTITIGGRRKTNNETTNADIKKDIDLQNAQHHTSISLLKEKDNNDNDNDDDDDGNDGNETDQDESILNDVAEGVFGNIEIGNKPPQKSVRI